MSVPSKSKSPDVLEMSRNTSRPVVDLPHPDSPTSPSVSPGNRSNSSLRRRSRRPGASTCPKRPDRHGVTRCGPPDGVPVRGVTMRGSASAVTQHAAAAATGSPAGRGHEPSGEARARQDKGPRVDTRGPSNNLLDFCRHRLSKATGGTSSGIGGGGAPVWIPLERGSSAGWSNGRAPPGSHKNCHSTSDHPLSLVIRSLANLEAESHHHTSSPSSTGPSSVDTVAAVDVSFSTTSATADTRSPSRRFITLTPCEARP